MKKNNFKIIALILSFGMAFNISSMEETEKVREKEEIKEKKEKRKNFFEDEQELKRVKLDESYFEDLPAELQTMLAQFVAGSVKDKEEVKETVKNLSNLAQTNKQLRDIIKSDEFQNYLLSLVQKNFPELYGLLDVKILIGTPYWVNKVKKEAEHNQTLKDWLAKEFSEAFIYVNIDKVKFLLKAGIVPNMKNNSLLMRSLMGGYYRDNRYKDIAKLLIKRGGNFNIKDNNGHVALVEAALYGYKEIVELLLDAGADPNIVEDNGNTALMVAAYNRRKEIIELLLEKNVEFNTKDKNGNTALMVAAKRGHKEIVKLLLNAGADLKIRNNKGQTALIAAAKRGHKEIVKLLLNAGADLKIRNNRGQTALELAEQNNYESIVQLLEDKDLKI